MNLPDRSAVKAELDELIANFFRAVSFESGSRPAYEGIPALFIERGVLIKNAGPIPEISSVGEFIEPREALVRSGTLTRFLESEISESTTIFGNVAHRFSAYAKSGTSGGAAFEARGMITTQFVNTPDGWKMSAMAWDDERPGLSLGGSPVSRNIVFTAQAGKPPPMYSQAVKAAGLVFVSGTAPIDPATGAIKGTTIQEQTAQCLTNVRAILEAAGSSLDKIASATVVLADEDDFAGMNEEWLRWFPSRPPARQGAKLPARIPGLKVSIAAIAEA